MEMKETESESENHIFSHAHAASTFHPSVSGKASSLAPAFKQFHEAFYVPTSFLSRSSNTYIHTCIYRYVENRKMGFCDTTQTYHDSFAYAYSLLLILFHFHIAL